MTALAQGAASTASTPLLSIRTTDGQRIVDPDDGTLSFTIVDVSSDTKEMTPVTAIATTVVDLDDDRIGEATGYFAAVFTLSGSETLGAHEIRWTWEVDGVPFTQVQRFDVFVGVPRGLGGGYVLVSKLRAEGIGKTQASDIQLLRGVREQSLFVERVTGRFFEPRYLDVKVDGFDTSELLFGPPIIALGGITVGDQAISLAADDEELVIYNRHLAGLTDPDDRMLPRVRVPRSSGLVFGDSDFDSDFGYVRSFPSESTGVVVQGLFGYTEFDGTAYGMTPPGLERLVMLLVIRNLPSLACESGTFEARMRHAATSLRTRDQSITWAETAVKSLGPTGDREIDMLISAYRRPPGVSSI